MVNYQSDSVFLLVEKPLVSNSLSTHLDELQKEKEAFVEENVLNVYQFPQLPE